MDKKNITKKIFKYIIKSKFFIMAIVVVSIFLIFFPSIIHFITIDDGTYKEKDWKSTPYVASNYTKNVSITNNGIQTTATSKDLWDKAVEEENNIEEYLDSPEELEKLMDAEIVTQYPKIGSGNLDGIIEFKRYKSDGTSLILKYANSDEFNNYINNNDIQALNYFTLDQSQNVVIAVANKKTEELYGNDSEMVISEYSNTINDSNKIGENNYKKVDYEMSTKIISYKDYVQKYTMPFEYLWAFLVITEDKDFVLELADLVKNSQIVISIYDNVTTTINEDTFEYKKQTRVDTYAKVMPLKDYGVDGYSNERYWVGEKMDHYNSKYPADYSTDDTEYKIIHKFTYENNTPIVDLTNANVWFIKMDKQYIYQKDDSQSPDVNNKNLEDTDYKEIEGSREKSTDNSELLKNQKAKSFSMEVKKYIEDNLPKTNNIVNDVNNNKLENSISNNIIESDNVEVNVTYVECSYYKHEVNRIQTSTVSTIVQKYVAESPVVTPKVEKNANEPNFVTIFCSEKNEKANEMVLEVSDWLFEILESNDDTKNMVEVTKYLLYKATDISFGQDTYDFSEYEKGKILDVGIVGGSFSTTKASLTKEDFVAAMKAYSNKISGNKKINFDTNFLPYIGDIYEWSSEYGINPELVIVTACTEQAFKAGGGAYNYWGIAVSNGSQTGSSFSSLREGIKGYADVIKSFQSGWKFDSINKIAEERKSAGVDSTGYGTPDTLSGIQILYSSLGNHIEGSSRSRGILLYGSCNSRNNKNL